MKASEAELAAGRAYAQWHLGDPGWADDLLRAMGDPERTWKRLADDGMRLAKEKTA